MRDKKEGKFTNPFKVEESGVKEKAAFFLLFGLAVVFLYAAVAAFLDPSSWSGFIPQFMRNIIPTKIFLTVFSVYQILLALWLFSKKKTFYAAVLSAATLFLIVVFNLKNFDIVFRDVAIFFAAVALALLSKER